MNSFHFFGIALIVMGLVGLEPVSKASNGSRYTSNSALCSGDTSSCYYTCDNPPGMATTGTDATVIMQDGTGTESGSSTSVHCYSSQDCNGTSLPNKACKYVLTIMNWSCDNNVQGATCRDFSAGGPVTKKNVTSYKDIGPIGEGG